MTKLPSEAREKLEPLRPSCSAVYQALHHSDRPLSSKEIEEATCLPMSTVRDALQVLRESDLVIKRRHVDNPRTPIYQVCINANSS